LQILVLVKAVPDPERANEITLDPETGTVKREGIPLVINPLDRNAVEEALRLKEEKGGTVAALSMGPPAAEGPLREALALGVDRAVLLSDRAMAGADTLATARVLAAGARYLGDFDLILCGAESFDGGTAQVGPELAQFLGLPHASYVTSAREKGGLLEVEAKVEDGRKKLQVRLPALLTVSRELNRPRGLSFSGIVRARGKKVEVLSLADLGMDPSRAGVAGSPTIIGDISTPTTTRSGEIIKGDPEEVVDVLVKKLTEAGVV